MSYFEAGFELGIWLIRLAFVIVIALLVALSVSSHNNREINIKSIEGDVILKRLFYSNDCFAYSDLRPYPGVVDAERFNDETIKKCLDGDYYVKAELVGSGISAYNNKAAFEEQIGFCKYENKYYCYKKEMYVALMDKGILRNDIMKMELVVPIDIKYGGYSKGLLGF